MGFDQRIEELGLIVPDFAAVPYTGLKYGSLKPHHRTGSLLFLSGHMPELPDGTVVHPGVLGRDLTVEQGYEAARVAGLNALGGIRFALGTLDGVVAVVRSLNFVVCSPDFHDVHLVADGVTDLLRDVFGDEAGVGGRATVGVTSLARGHCFETWLTLEVCETGPEQAVDPASGVPEVQADPAEVSVAPGPGVPARSSLLARSAALPPADRAALAPGAAFGWAEGLTPDEVLAIGRVVRDMLAAGAPPDLDRGFGLAWDGGVRLPNRHTETLFGEFTELQITVGGVLAGRDLRAGAVPAPRPGGLAALFGGWLARADPVETEAAAAVDRRGPEARSGLIALWNAWMAMRFRQFIPPPTFELLVAPWVAVVGPVPEA
jgi:enamine deaminase RidA (YjgF/YER057c/UK114 family)